MTETEEKIPTRRELRERKTKNRRTWTLAVPFFAVLFALSVIAFIIPLRPTESIGEKRSLAEFPEFSVGTLLSGEYFDGISLWFSDTFPGRETWIAASTRLDTLHGLNDVVIYGEIGSADEIPVVTDTPDETAEPTETPTPTATPSPTPEPTLPPTPEVVVTSPPEDSVEHWSGIYTDNDADVIFGNVIQIGDAAFAYYGFSEYMSDRHVALMDNCAEILAEYDIDLYDILVPTSVGVLVSSDYMEKLNCSDQGASISYIFSQENDLVKKVNIFNTLVDHNTEYLYFRTDHHWTALGAYYGYAQFCAVAGYDAAELSDFTELDMGEYYGSFYSTCAQSSKLKVDNVYAYDPPGNFDVMITNANGETFPWTVLTDMSKSSIYSKYMCFIAGDNPLTVITNNDLPDAPDCVVIKDSFGNPFVPYLTQNYHTIYVLDYRKYGTMRLRHFVQYYGVDDVLIVESLTMAQGDGTLDLLEWLCG